MKQSSIALVGCVLSFVAVTLAFIYVLTVENYSVAICFGTIAVFCSNLTIYAATKKKERESAIDSNSAGDRQV